MNIETVKKDIKSIEQLLSSIKQALDISETGEVNKSEKVVTKKRKKPVGVKTSIVDYIKNGFFDTPKTSQDIVVEFKKRALTGYTSSSISMALMLLVRKGTLERNGAGTSKSPWNYKKI